MAPKQSKNATKNDDDGFTHVGRTHGPRAWKCTTCSNQPQFARAPDKGRWNNAQKEICGGCSGKPNRRCILWGEGCGKNGGKWLPYVDGVLQSAGQGDKAQSPSKRTDAQLQRNADKQRAEQAELKKLRNENKELRKGKESSVSASHLLAAVAGDHMDVTPPTSTAAC